MTYADGYNIRTTNVKSNDVADAVDGLITRTWGGTTTGTSTAYACTPSPAWTAYTTGYVLWVIPHTANGSAPTINVNSLGTKTIQRFGTALVGNELKASVPAMLVYDGTNFQYISYGCLAPLFVDPVNGQVGINTTAPASSHKLDVRGRMIVGGGSSDAEVYWRDTGSTTVRWAMSTRTDVGGSNADIKLLRFNSSGVYQAIDMQITEAGNVFFAQAAGDTTASAANCYLQSSDGRLMRSTSSGRYKTGVESIEPSKSNAVLSLQPVWYRSTAKADRKDWSFYGLIAEDVAAVEPRLVHWGYRESDYELVDTEPLLGDPEIVLDDIGKPVLDENGEAITVRRPMLDEDGKPVKLKEKRLKADAQLVPESVQYDRVAVLLLDVVKRQQDRLAALEARLAALEAKIGGV